MRKRADKRLDFWQLEVLRTVAETRSFSRAAEVLFLSQPTITAHISALEKKLGVRLFERTTRKVLLTPAGQLLYRHAKTLLHYEKLTLEDLSHFLGGTEGTLNLGASTIPAHYILPDLLGRFFKSHPAIRITLTVMSSMEIIDRVAAGNLDVGVVGQRPDDQYFHVYPLWDDEVVLICSSRHRWAKKGSLSVHDLKDALIALREEGSGTRATFLQFLNHCGISLRELTVTAQLGSTEALKKFVMETECLAPVSLRAVGAEQDRGELSVARIREGRMTRRFYAITPKDLPETPITRTFRRFLLRTRPSD